MWMARWSLATALATACGPSTPGGGANGDGSTESGDASSEDNTASEMSSTADNESGVTTDEGSTGTNPWSDCEPRGGAEVVVVLQPHVRAAGECTVLDLAPVPGDEWIEAISFECPEFADLGMSHTGIDVLVGVDSGADLPFELPVVVGQTYRLATGREGLTADSMWFSIRDLADDTLVLAGADAYRPEHLEGTEFFKPPLQIDLVGGACPPADDDPTCERGAVDVLYDGEATRLFDGNSATAGGAYDLHVGLAEICEGIPFGEPASRVHLVAARRQ